MRYKAVKVLPCNGSCWLCSAGAIPIPGCKTVPQVQEHVGAMGWRLDSNEVAIIDEKLQSM